MMGDTVRVIEIVSYALIVLLGARLFWVKGRGFLNALHALRSGPSEAAAESHSHASRTLTPIAIITITRTTTMITIHPATGASMNMITLINTPTITTTRKAPCRGDMRMGPNRKS